MTTPALLKALGQVFSWKYNSLAAYITAAKPYVKTGQEEILERLRLTAAEDRELRDRIGALIVELRGVARVEPHPPQVSELNYLSLEYLRRVLLGELQRQLSELELFARELEADSKAAELFVDLVHTTRAQIERLTL